MPLLLSACLGLIPMLLFAVYVNWLDRYEKEPKWLLVSTFLWGAVIASTLAFVINTLTGLGMYLLTASEAFADLSTSVFIAPLVEESLKGMALLGLFFAFHSEFDSLLDGAVYGGMIGLGFGATENFYYIYAHGYQEEGWAGLWGVAFIRIVLIGWQHAFYTALSGIGLARARLSRSSFLRLFFALGGFTLAVLTHALHNALASLAGWWTVLLDWAGWAGMLVLILLFIQQEQRLLKKHLQEEVERAPFPHPSISPRFLHWLKLKPPGTRSRTKICARHGVSISSVRNWLTRRNSLSVWGRSRGIRGSLLSCGRN
jgi:RsiW-degrading membrane proteinase PrsW (M82 family)